MPKSKSKRSKSNTQTPKKSNHAKAKTRRDMLQNFAWLGLGGLVVVGGGTAFALDFRSKLAETDLTKIGQGVPTIVQIHDPQCTSCARLQRETRTALKAFDETEIQYLVANIRSDDGRAFQNRTGLPHVTLVLMDGAGQTLDTVSGVTPSAQLEATFRQVFGL